MWNASDDRGRFQLLCVREASFSVFKLIVEEQIQSLY